jgi:hypothetical protein
MNFHTNELTIDLPEIINDRSVNMLTVAGPQGGVPFQIVINRDLLLGGETLQQCFDRQVGQMTRQTQAFRAVAKRTLEIGPDKLEGLEIESSFTQSGRHFHQLQAMWVTQTPRILALTLSSPVAISEGQRTIWRQVIESVKSRPADPAAAYPSNPA